MAWIKDRWHTTRKNDGRTVRTSRYRHGRRWLAGYRGPDHKQRTEAFARRVDAERWLAAQGAAIARDEWVDARLGKVTFAAHADQWLATKADVAPRTRINIEGRLRNHAVPFFGPMELAAIRPTHVRSWVAGLTAARLAPGTVKATYLTTSQVFAQAVTDGIIARTPCRDIKLPREREHEEQHYLSAEQVNALAGAISDRYRALIYTAAYSGLRAGELVALKADHLHLLAKGKDGGTLDVVESMSEVRGRLELGPTKTGAVRTITLPRFLAQMLGEHVGRYPSPDGYVFTSAEGKPLRHRNFYARRFRPAVERVEGVPDDLRFHDLRHTCAALLIADRRSIKEVKDHLGHSSIRVTSDRYGHLFPKARQDIAEGLDARYASALGPRPADQLRTRGQTRPIRGARKEPGKGA